MKTPAIRQIESTLRLARLVGALERADSELTHDRAVVLAKAACRALYVPIPREPMSNPRLSRRQKALLSAKEFSQRVINA